MSKFEVRKGKRAVALDESIERVVRAAWLKGDEVERAIIEAHNPGMKFTEAQRESFPAMFLRLAGEARE